MSSILTTATDTDGVPMSHDPLPDPAPGLIADELGAALTVRDLATSSAWYREVLGFTIDRRHEREGRLFALSLRAGEVRLLLSQDDRPDADDRVKGAGLSLQLTTSQEIDLLAARATAHGATFDTAPVTMPWGVRVFRLRDPDGFRFTISSPPPTT